MSESILYTLTKTGVNHYDEFGNGWLVASIWEYLYEKYIAEEKYFMSRDAKRVFALHRSPSIEEFERYTLRMTFDRTYFPINKLDLMVGYCMTLPIKNGRWREIGESLHRLRPTEDTIGVCLTPTTVNDEWRKNADWAKNPLNMFADDY